VRADHVARAVENRVWFVRGNNVTPKGPDPAIQQYDGVGYGDSYIVDPAGEILVRSRRHQEDFLFADIDPHLAEDQTWTVGRSRWSARELGRIMLDAAAGTE
jgi:predicted amidohydrolase